jgi:hypothetical protein
MARPAFVALLCVATVAACGTRTELVDPSFSSGAGAPETAPSPTTSDPSAALDGSTTATADASAAADAGGAQVARVPYRALAVTTGATHTCALLDDHSVKCWGDGSMLGYGDAKSRGRFPSEMGDALPTVDLGAGRTATAISAGRYVTCALLDDGSVKCWGYGGYAGQPSTNNIGDAPGEMGDLLPRLDLGGHRATRIAAGRHSSCAIVDDGSLWCWGVTPKTPLPVPLPSRAPIRQLSNGANGGIIALLDDGTVVSLTGAELTPALASASSVIAVAAGEYYECALLSGGAVRCSSGPALDWNAPPTTVGIGVGEQGVFRCARLSDGSVRCSDGRCAATPTAYWCAPDVNEDGSRTVLLGEPATALTSEGSIQQCALLASGRIKCWGETMPGLVSYLFGAGVTLVEQNGQEVYGAWNDVDLGTHPAAP